MASANLAKETYIEGKRGLYNMHADSTYVCNGLGKYTYEHAPVYIHAHAARVSIHTHTRTNSLMQMNHRLPPYVSAYSHTHKSAYSHTHKSIYSRTHKST